MLHGYQAESELFRDGDDDDGEDEYQQHLRRMREIDERKQAEAVAKGATKAATSPHCSPAIPDVRTALESEHAQRQDARQRLLEKDGRFQGYLEQLASGEQKTEEAPVVTRSELEAAMRENARDQGKEASEFVQAFR